MKVRKVWLSPREYELIQREKEIIEDNAISTMFANEPDYYGDKPCQQQHMSENARRR